MRPRSLSPVSGPEGEEGKRNKSRSKSKSKSRKASDAIIPTLALTLNSFSPSSKPGRGRGLARLCPLGHNETNIP
jgi:hypothetical protein